MYGRTARKQNLQVQDVARGTVGCFDVLYGLPSPYPGAVAGADGAAGDGSATLANTRVYVGAAYSASSSTPTVVRAGSVSYDASADGSTFYNNASFAYVTAAEQRRYYVNAHITYTKQNDDPAKLQVYVNGASVFEVGELPSIEPGQASTIQFERHFIFPASASVQLRLYQDTVAVDTLTVQAGESVSYYSIIALSAV